MTYKHLPYAFLFEAVVGLLSLLAVIVYGRYGIFVLLFMSARPFFLERDESGPDEDDVRVYWRAYAIAAVLTLFSILASLAVMEIRWYAPEGARYLPLLALAWFVLAHGLAGYILSNKES